MVMLCSVSSRIRFVEASSSLLLLKEAVFVYLVRWNSKMITTQPPHGLLQCFGLLGQFSLWPSCIRSIFSSNCLMRFGVLEVRGYPGLGLSLVKYVSLYRSIAILINSYEVDFKLKNLRWSQLVFMLKENK